MHAELIAIMQEILEKHSTTVEEDNELLKNEMDWPTRCAILYRRNEKESI
jgi:hypothetical protein